MSTEPSLCTILHCNASDEERETMLRGSFRIVVRDPGYDALRREVGRLLDLDFVAAVLRIDDKESLIDKVYVSSSDSTFSPWHFSCQSWGS